MFPHGQIPQEKSVSTSAKSVKGMSAVTVMPLKHGLRMENIASMTRYTDMTKSEFTNRLHIIDRHCTEEGLTWYEVTGLEAEDVLHFLISGKVAGRSHIWNTIIEVSDEIKEGA